MTAGLAEVEQYRRDMAEGCDQRAAERLLAAADCGAGGGDEFPW